MESLKENKPLLYSIIFSASAAVALAARISPEFNEQFQIVEFTVEFRNILLAVIGLDFLASLTIDKSLEFFFGKASLRKV